MSTLGQKPATTHVSTEKQSITGNGGTSYTLQQSVSQASDIEVFVNNTRQEPTVAYTASGTTLTMTGAVNSSDSFYVIFQGIAIQTAGLPVDAAITASAITASQTITSTGNITTSGTLNTPSINGEQIGGRRNIVINGAMQVAQRSTSVTGLGNSNGYNTLDRFGYFGSSSGRFTQSQDTDAPDGFSKSLKIACTTADTSIAATEYLHLNYSIEGQDLQQLNYNTSSAKSTTISFYVKGNASATYTFRLQYHKSGGTARWYAKEFPVTTSWVRQTITIPGDTDTSSSYGIVDDANTGMFLIWYLHGGTNYSSGTYASEAWEDRDYTKSLGNNQTSFYDSTARTFSITGLQMEVGSQATPFEHRSFGEELALCKRYFQKSYDVNVAPATSTTTGQFNHNFLNLSNFGNVVQRFSVSMRSSPSMTVYDGSSGTVNTIRYWDGSAEVTRTTNFSLTSSTEQWNMADDTFNHTNIVFQWTANAEL